MISWLTKRLWLVGVFSFRYASCSLSFFLLLSFAFVPFQVLRFVYSFWSHEIGNNLYSDGRSFSPEKIFHDIFRTQLVCLTLWQREPFIGMVLPITNCAQGMPDVRCSSCLLRCDVRWYAWSVRLAHFIANICNIHVVFSVCLFFYRICCVSAIVCDLQASSSNSLRRVRYFWDQDVSFFLLKIRGILL